MSKTQIIALTSIIPSQPSPGFAAIEVEAATVGGVAFFSGVSLATACDIQMFHVALAVLDRIPWTVAAAPIKAAPIRTLTTIIFHSDLISGVQLIIKSIRDGKAEP